MIHKRLPPYLGGNVFKKILGTTLKGSKLFFKFTKFFCLSCLTLKACHQRFWVASKCCTFLSHFGTFYLIIQLQHSIPYFFLEYNNNFYLILKIKLLSFKRSFVHLFWGGTCGAGSYTKWIFFLITGSCSKSV